MLGDVSTMVKGIGSNANEGATRLYHPPSVSRPSSSHGMKSRPKKLTVGSDISDDETDWAALAQNSPMKATNRTTLSDDDDFMDIDDKPPPKPVAKPAPKAKLAAAKVKESVALKPKKAANVAPTDPPAPKLQPLSPAAKAYAAKKAKPDVQAKAGALKPPAKPTKKKVVESDDDDVDALANDILSDDDDDDSPVKPVARPSRRAAATKKATYAVEDDEDEDEESEADLDNGDDDDSD